MVGVTNGLKRSILTIFIIYLISGIIAICVSVGFWLTPIKRRSILLSLEQITMGFTIGVIMILNTIPAILAILSTETNKSPSRRWNASPANTNTKFINKSRLCLKIYNLFLIITVILTLALGAFVWFGALDIRNGYGKRWLQWDSKIKALFQKEENCCGYISSTDQPIITNTCPLEIINSGVLPGCADNIYAFVNDYLKNIYSCLFLFAAVDVIALLASLVLNQALIDQARYDRSFRKRQSMAPQINEKDAFSPNVFGRKSEHKYTGSFTNSDRISEINRSSATFAPLNTHILDSSSFMVPYTTQFAD